jgi:hypothetical protein
MKDDKIRPPLDEKRGFNCIRLYGLEKILWT